MSDDIINLDALVPKTITFTKTLKGESRSWQLRDEMPPEVLLPVLRLMLHDQQRARIPLPSATGDAAATDTDAAEAALKLLDEALTAQISETLSAFAVLWHYSYPQDATEDLATWFSHKERQEILKLFFTRHSSASSARSNTTDIATPMADATAATESTIETTPSPNRATRRHSSRAAIPSQKRLSRELRGL